MLEEFVYDGEGQMMSQSFMDYLMPSSREVPRVEIVHHCTPSPLTTFGQKGSGEAGYLGSPAAIANAVNDALAPLNAVWTLLGRLLHKVMSPLVLGVLYFLVITPFAFLFRLLKRDPLHLKISKDAESYWIRRDPEKQPGKSMVNQF